MFHKKRRESTKTGDDHRLSLAETTWKNSVFTIYIYIACIYYIQSARIYSSPRTWTSSSFSTSSSSNVRKKDININTHESSETFRRVDRTAADFNRLGDFYDRDNAHGDRVFSDRDKREHGRYVYYIYEKSVCFFLVLPYLCWPFLLFFSSLQDGTCEGL